MAQGERAQVGNFQVSGLQVGLFELPEPKDISATSNVDFDSVGVLFRRTSFSSSSTIDFDTDASLSRNTSLKLDDGEDSFEAQFGRFQVSGSQFGRFEERISPSTSIELESQAHLSLRSNFIGESSQIVFDSDGIAGVDVYVDGQTSEVEFISEGVVGIDKDILTTSQLELVTSGELEIIVLFSNESCLIGVVNTESEIVGIEDIESTAIGIIEICDIA